MTHLSQLAYLHHARLAPAALRPRALPERFVELDNIPAAAIDCAEAWSGMPPLIKVLLRVGAMIGHDAITKSDLGTLDVCFVSRTDRVPEKNRSRYQRWLRGEVIAPSHR
ncbi:MAG: hypothetical protein JSU82_15330 [Rhodospirillales bacterium]|nr:MAG: hypothetical protein JSU82_15330 [Rhodospirillales bacterium]